MCMWTLWFGQDKTLPHRGTALLYACDRHSMSGDWLVDGAWLDFQCFETCHPHCVERVYMAFFLLLHPGILLYSMCILA